MADNPLVATTNDTCTCEALQCSADSESTSIGTSEPVRLKFLTHTRGKQSPDLHYFMWLLKALRKMNESSSLPGLFYYKAKRSESV
jgi:hypothetical protein